MSSSPCNSLLLKPYNSYGIPLFVERSYYLDIEFTCCDCGKHGVWKAQQQKWWYETAKGNVESRAIRCRSCRKIKRERKEGAPKTQKEELQKRHDQMW
ncbi:MAG: zinc-ribbon domain containing protein [Methylomicrobium sp.]